MRQERTVQATIFDRFAGHEIGRELKAMSAWPLQSAVAGVSEDHLGRTRVGGSYGQDCRAAAGCLPLYSRRLFPAGDVAHQVVCEIAFLELNELSRAVAPG